MWLYTPEVNEPNLTVRKTGYLLRSFLIDGNKDEEIIGLVRNKKSNTKRDIEVVFVTPYHHTNNYKVTADVYNILEDRHKIVIFDGEPNDMYKSFKD